MASMDELRREVDLLTDYSEEENQDLYDTLFPLEYEDIKVIIRSLIDCVSRHDDALGVAIEAVARLQNTIDDLIFTNKLELKLDHSKSALENKERIERFKQQVKAYNNG